MTICIATDGFPPQVGGIATFNQHLVTLLLNAGHHVIVLYIDYENNNENDSVITENSFTKVHLKKTFTTHYKKWQPYFKPGGFNAPNWIATGLAMREWLLNNHRLYNIDIIEASDYGGCGIFLCDAALPPVVITGHGSLLQYSRYNYTNKDDNYTVVRKLEELSFTHADAVIAHSPLNKNDLEQLFNREIAFASIPWINDKNIPADSALNNELVVVGGLQPIKGIYDMAEAMVILRQKQIDIHLKWIGGDTWLAPGQQKMSSYLQEKYPSAWQKTMHWENEKPYAYTQEAIESAGLVIIPAFFETFNYIALEAAAYKKPIIITEGTGASFLFTHGEDAWKVPSSNPAALAEAILYLTGKKELCHALGEKAYETVQKVFDPSAIVAERMEIYKTAVQKRKVRIPAGGFQFIYSYRATARKYYYCIRSFAKKIIGRRAS